MPIVVESLPPEFDSFDLLFDTLKEHGKRLGNTGSKKLTKLKDFVIKQNRRERNEDEAALLEFIRNNTKIPVPRVLKHIIDDECCELDDKTMLVMSFEEGETLESQWPSLDEETKRDIQSQLNEFVLELRSLERPSKQPLGTLKHHQCIDTSRHGRRGGPFYEVGDFTKFLLEATVDYVDVKKGTGPILESIYSQERYNKKARVYLTHADIHPRNILVKDGKITAILDWEDGGWYPEHWEYVKALYTLEWEDDWALYLPEAMGVYADEWCHHRLLETLID